MGNLVRISHFRVLPTLPSVRNSYEVSNLHVYENLHGTGRADIQTSWAVEFSICCLTLRQRHECCKALIFILLSICLKFFGLLLRWRFFFVFSLRLLAYEGDEVGSNDLAWMRHVNERSVATIQYGGSGRSVSLRFGHLSLSGSSDFCCHLVSDVLSNLLSIF